MGRRLGNMLKAWSVSRPDSSTRQRDRSRITAFLVDLVGRRGYDLEGLKQGHANIKGKLILQDRLEVVSMAELSPEIEKMAHDFNLPQPIKGEQYSRICFHHQLTQPNL